MKASIVIPTYNEGGRIGAVIKGIRLKHKSIGIIIVDDGSGDQTQKVLGKFKDKKLQVLKHKVNLGKGAAMRTGALYAFENGYDSVIFMDADGQHSPEDLDKFITKLKDNELDIIFGIRKEAKDVPLIRGFGNKIGIVIVYLFFGIKVSDLLCGYRAITKNAFKKLDLKSSGYGIETEMVAKTGLYKLKYTQVVVKTIYHDTVKGVTMLDAVSIFWDVLKWRLNL